MSELSARIEAVHAELDVLNTILGVNGQVSYEKVQDIVKDIRSSLERLNEFEDKLENKA